MLARSKNFVQRWNYAYRDGGMEAVCPRRQTGRPTTLPRDQEAAFKQRMLNGPPQTIRAYVYLTRQRWPADISVRIRRSVLAGWRL